VYVTLDPGLLRALLVEGSAFQWGSATCVELYSSVGLSRALQSNLVRGFFSGGVWLHGPRLPHCWDVPGVLQPPVYPVLHMQRGMSTREHCAPGGMYNNIPPRTVGVGSLL
jgi:hypothetical protein